jgi:hypothetical protein
VMLGQHSMRSDTDELRSPCWTTYTTSTTQRLRVVVFISVEKT